MSVEDGMTPEAYFTKHLGIAPLTTLPKGVRIEAFFGATPEAALEAYRRAYPGSPRPYWQIRDETLHVVTDETHVGRALWDLDAEHGRKYPGPRRD